MGLTSRKASGKSGFFWGRGRSKAAAEQRDEYLRQIDAFDSRIVEHDYGGTSLAVRIADPQAELWYDHDWTAFDVSHIEQLAKGKLRDGARIFDIGAHQGVVACLLAERVGPSGSVLAIDPHPHNVEIARENARLNGFHQVVVLKGAVGARRGRLGFSHRLNSTATEIREGGGFEYEMDASTVDDLVDRHGLPDVLFIDVVGFEHRVLLGAERTLRTQPDCFVEVHVDTGLTEVGDSVQDVLTHFSPDDYDLYVASATEAEHEFVPIHKARWRLQERFYLVALARP